MESLLKPFPKLPEWFRLKAAAKSSRQEKAQQTRARNRELRKLLLKGRNLGNSQQVKRGRGHPPKASAARKGAQKKHINLRRPLSGRRTEGGLRRSNSIRREGAMLCISTLMRKEVRDNPGVNCIKTPFRLLVPAVQTQACCNEHSEVATVSPG